MIPYTLNIIGLSLDIIGAGLIFRFGIPSLLVQKYVPDPELWDRIRARLGKVGIAFLITGFISQLVANILLKP